MPIGDFALADVVLAGLVLLSAGFGVARGLMKEVLSLVIWGAAVLLALAFGTPLGQLILDADAKLQTAIGFVLVLVAVLIAGALVLRLVNALVKTTGLSGTDRVLGFAFGAARGLVVAVFGLILLRPFAAEREWWQESHLVPPLLAYEADVLALADALGDAFREATEGEPAGDHILRGVLGFLFRNVKDGKPPEAVARTISSAPPTNPAPI